MSSTKIGMAEGFRDKPNQAPKQGQLEVKLEISITSGKLLRSSRLDWKVQIKHVIQKKALSCSLRPKDGHEMILGIGQVGWKRSLEHTLKGMRLGSND